MGVLDDKKDEFQVYVDDNFHYIDVKERYTHGSFATLDDAIAACRRIVEGEVRHMYKPGMSAEELYSLYTNFGEDPFIRSTTKNAGGLGFRSWHYARELADKMCASSLPGPLQDDIN